MNYNISSYHNEIVFYIYIYVTTNLLEFEKFH